MNGIPVTTSEHFDYFPPSLGNLEPRPTFRFRPPSPRAKRRYSHDLQVEGLRYHSSETVQAETIRALRALWIGDADLLAENEARFNAFWETVRQAEKDKSVLLDPVEAEAMAAAMTKLTDNWPALRRMNADNNLFNADAPKIALARFLCGWSGLATPFRLEDGAVPLETLDALEAEIESIEEKAKADGVEGILGVAFKELELHALGLMDLVQDTEKNSQSPSSPSGTPNGSATDGSAAAPQDGKSETSPSRPARRREPETTTSSS